MARRRKIDTTRWRRNAEESDINSAVETTVNAVRGCEYDPAPQLALEMRAEGRSLNDAKATIAPEPVDSPPISTQLSRNYQIHIDKRVEHEIQRIRLTAIQAVYDDEH